jgi:hypothetical protein
MKRGIFILCLALTSCSALTQKATATPTVSPTSTETATLVPSSTPTSTSTKTPLDINNLEFLGVKGLPAKEYKGWKIMPEAITGQEKDGNYIYTIKSNIGLIADFYRNNFPKGWNLFSTDVITDKNEVMMMFRSGKQSAIILGGEYKNNPDFCFVIISVVSG